MGHTRTHAHTRAPIRIFIYSCTMPGVGYAVAEWSKGYVCVCVWFAYPDLRIHTPLHNIITYNVEARESIIRASTTRLLRVSVELYARAGGWLYQYYARIGLCIRATIILLASPTDTCV